MGVDAAADAEGAERERRPIWASAWREELAAGIVANLDWIDVVEVIAESALAGGSRRLRALRTLARQVPVLVHGVGLGLASCSPVDERRLDATARVVDAIGPEHWSEHTGLRARRRH